MQNSEQPAEESQAVTVIPPGAMEAIERANVDMQIATAHKYPRSIEKFQKRATTMATMDKDTARSCIYNRPVGKDKTGKIKYVEGESIRLAEIVAASYGNIRAGSMLIEQNSRQVKARGFCHDLENNVGVSTEVVESTVDREGMPFSERMRVVVAKATLAKARRDAIFQVIPKAMCKAITNAAKAVVFDKRKPLDERKKVALDWLDTLKVSPERVWTALGIAGASEIGEEHLELLTGIRTAIDEGDSTIAEAFPLIGSTEELKGTKAERLVGKLSKSQGKDTSQLSSSGKRPPEGEPQKQGPTTPASQSPATSSPPVDQGEDIHKQLVAAIKARKKVKGPIFFTNKLKGCNLELPDGEWEKLDIDSLTILNDALMGK